MKKKARTKDMQHEAWAPMSDGTYLHIAWLLQLREDHSSVVSRLLRVRSGFVP